jgi:hypothetical protein
MYEAFDTKRLVEYEKVYYWYDGNKINLELSSRYMCTKIHKISTLINIFQDIDTN